MVFKRIIKSLFKKKKNKENIINSKKNNDIDFEINSLFIKQEEIVEKIYSLIPNTNKLNDFKNCYNFYKEVKVLIPQLQQISREVLLEIKPLINKIKDNQNYLNNFSESSKTNTNINAQTMIIDIENRYNQILNNRKKYLKLMKLLEGKIIEYQRENLKVDTGKLNTPSKELQKIILYYKNIKKDFFSLKEEYNLIRKNDIKYHDTIEDISSVNNNINLLFNKQEKKVLEIYSIISRQDIIESYQSYYNHFTKVEPLVFNLHETIKAISIEIEKILFRIKNNEKYLKNNKTLSINIIDQLSEFLTRITMDSSKYYRLAKELRREIITYQKNDAQSSSNSHLEVPKQLQQLVLKFIDIKQKFLYLKKEYNSIKINENKLTNNINKIKYNKAS